MGKEIGFLKGLAQGLGIIKSDKKAIGYVPSGMPFIYGEPNIEGETKTAKKEGVEFSLLRKIAEKDAVLGISIMSIKKEISQAEWTITNHKMFKRNQDQIARGQDLFLRINENGESLSSLLSRTIDDLLTLDAGVWEKQYNVKGELVGLNSVDGATILPRVNEYGDFDPEKAYVQVIDGKQVAEFKGSEIMYVMANPHNDVKRYGFGQSPIERILLTVQSALSADLYNAQSFSEDNVPPGIIDLGGMSNAQAKEFTAMWNATVIGNTQKLKFIWGSDNAKKYIPFQQNNKDMQFIEYIDWLTRLKLAAYGLTAQDVNLTQDLNRATAFVQKSISNSRGVRSVMKLLEDFIYRDIFYPLGLKETAFKFEKTLSWEEKETQATIDNIYVGLGVYSPSFVANRDGYSTIDQDVEEEYDYSMEEDLEEEGISDGESLAEDEGEVKPVAEQPEKKHSEYYKPLYN